MLHQLSKKSFLSSVWGLVVLRVVLGTVLLIKGIFFIDNTVLLENLITQSGFQRFNAWLPLVITWAHLLGGCFIILGLLTRWAVILQLPILLGAVLLVNSAKGTFVIDFEFILSVVILFLLVIFLIIGSGPISMDDYRKKHQL